ncbi:PREDICTED: uncharacterized protein LOC109587899 [Amphimedon queenslandica]|uniref:Uncharacterized protein n=1 Tax=Amphimedon queenslandica TaxID=400682 RepID=A0AAN0JS38_AMPQE|nr:PREDICTED: uncharacterized protein LOC109587899 [Amphimedon queenslandica]|eukprot:XP_019859680.1 PREDICTED: uncharacterized protein LOC109587899 [Amphimedon queenslandica]
MASAEMPALEPETLLPRWYEDLMRQIKNFSDRENAMIVELFKLVLAEVLKISQVRLDAERITFMDLYRLIEEKVTREAAPTIVLQILEKIDCTGCDCDELKKALKDAAASENADLGHLDIDPNNIKNIVKLSKKVFSLNEEEFKAFKGYCAAKVLPKDMMPNISNISDCKFLVLLIENEKLLSGNDRSLKEIDNLLKKSGCSQVKGNPCHRICKYICRVVFFIILIAIFLTSIAMLLFAIYFLMSNDPKTIPLLGEYGTSYEDQTKLLVSYHSQTISINISVSFNQNEGSNGPVNIRIYKSIFLPKTFLQNLPPNYIPGLSGGRHNYNYISGDIPIFLQKGSSLNYTLYFKSNGYNKTCVLASDNCASLYLFDNFKDYNNFRNNRSNFAYKEIHITSSNLSWSFTIDHDSIYYVALEVENCCLVFGNVSVTQASYESLSLSQVCTLNVSRPSCVIDLYHRFKDCDNEGHVFVNIPAGNAVKEISYSSKHYYFPCNSFWYLIAFIIFAGFIFCLYLIKCYCWYKTTETDSNRYVKLN